MITPHLERSLVAKYNRPGPRYTSYPTALQFSPATPPSALLDQVNAGNGPLSLYFHLPFCESLCWFCACAKEITTDTHKADIYLDYLEKEIGLLSPHLQANRTTEQLHYGGGSPSFLTPTQLRRLNKILADHFDFSPDAECSVELDPRTLTLDKVAALAEGGFRRASFGVQDVNPAVQEAVHRVQPSELNRKTLHWLRDAGFNSINVDLIYGLPKQSVESFSETLDEVLTYQPDRFAVFSYAHVPWVAPAQKILSRDSLPSPELKLSMLEVIIERLTNAGYRYIGMDHFARADDELALAQLNGTLHRNFQGYSTRAGREIAAFGMSAISQTAHSYRQNEKTLDAYYAALDQNRPPIERGYILTPDDLIRRSVIMDLMCHGSIDYAKTSQRLGIDFTAYFKSEIQSLDTMETDGLLSRHPTHLQVLPAGWLLIRNIAMQFDHYLSNAANRHAQTL